MKILLVGHGLSLGGGERYLLNQAILLTSIGYDVECIVFEDGPLGAIYQQQNISYSVCSIPHLDSQKIYEMVKKCDFVIANTMYAIFFAHEAQKYKPTMLILHDCLSYMENIFSRTSLARRELADIRHIYGVSKYHAEMLKKSGFIRVNILNNFVQDTYCARSYATEYGKVKFLTVANWNLVKGYDLALEIFMRLSAKEKEQIEWHIVGKMENDQVCVNFLHKAKSEPWIIFHGAISDKNEMYRIYMENDVYLHMSREDSCPLAVIDAAMLHMPLIVSKDTGANYLAENGAGWIVDEYSFDAAANAIREALHRKDRLKKMGEIARKNYLRNATPEIYTQRLVEEIKAIIEEDMPDCQNSDFNITENYSKQKAEKKGKKECALLKIGLYGYNMYAQIEEYYSKNNCNYNLIGIYDRDYESFKRQGINISSPEELAQVDFDYICICCIYKSTIQAIERYLMGIGIPKEKICIGLESILSNI